MQKKDSLIGRASHKSPGAQHMGYRHWQSKSCYAELVSIRLTHGQKSAAEHHVITAPGLIGQDD
jgi:hypothetical protein